MHVTILCVKNSCEIQVRDKQTNSLAGSNQRVKSPGHQGYSWKHLHSLTHSLLSLFSQIPPNPTPTPGLVDRAMCSLSTILYPSLMVGPLSHINNLIFIQWVSYSFINQVSLSLRGRGAFTQALVELYTLDLCVHVFSQQ